MLFPFRFHSFIKFDLPEVYLYCFPSLNPFYMFIYVDSSFSFLFIKFDLHNYLHEFYLYRFPSLNPIYMFIYMNSSFIVFIYKIRFTCRFT